MNNLYKNVKIVNISTMIHYYEKLYINELKNQIEWINKNGCICDDTNDDIFNIGHTIMKLYDYENINGVIFAIDNMQSGFYEMWVVNFECKTITYIDDMETYKIDDDIFVGFDVGYFGKYVRPITNDKLWEFVSRETI